MKVRTLITTLGTLFAAISGVAQTNVVVNNICYELKSDGAYVAAAETKETYTGDIVIPEDITVEEQTYSVVGINANAFDGTTNVTSITIPATVTTLGKNCIANLPSLSRLTFADGDTPISITGTRKEDSPVYKCSIEDIYVGRNFNIASKAYLLSNSIIENIGFGKSILSIPSHFFMVCSLSTNAEGRFEIPEGIMEIKGSAIDIDGVNKVVLPSTLRIFNKAMIELNVDDLSGITLESKANVPTYFDSASALVECFYQYGFKRFSKLIVPAGCKGYYEACNWTGIADVVEEAEPEQGGNDPIDPEPPVQKAYVSLVHSHADGAVSYPRIETVQGGDFLLSVGVDKGWLISSASFEADEATEPEPTNAPCYAEENTESNTITVEKIEDSNCYNITVKNIIGDGKLSYVVEKEIPTDVENPADDASKPRVKVVGGEIHVCSPKGCGAKLYDLNGNLISSQSVKSDSTVTFYGLDRGVYLLKVGVHTFKIAI